MSISKICLANVLVKKAKTTYFANTIANTK